METPCTSREPEVVHGRQYTKTHRCILSVAVGSWFPQAQVRQEKSLMKPGVVYDFAKWTNKYPPGCPTHQERPYAFKAFALKWAREAGYTSCLWLDSAMYAQGSVLPIFGYIEENGYMFTMDGTSISTSIADISLKKLEMTRDEADLVPCLFAGCTGLSFTSNIGNEFLDRWMTCVMDQEINPSGSRFNRNKEWSQDERCLYNLGEQASASILRYRMGLKAVPYGEFYVMGDHAAEKGIIVGAGM